MEFVINPVQLLKGLSMAMEFSSGGMYSHQWHVAIVADRIGEALKLVRGEQRKLVYAALLHDVGAVADWHENINLFSRCTSSDSYQHAERGYELLKNSKIFGNMAEAIRYQHEYWDGSSPSGRKGKEIPLVSRIIHLADSLEIRLNEKCLIFTQVQNIMQALWQGSGTEFDPQLVDVLQKLSGQESFWLDIENPYYFQMFFDHVAVYGDTRYSLDEVMEIAELMATIVDRADQRTGTHSRRVAVAAAYLAERKGFSRNEVRLMRIAGLLHDLGKLSVSNHILEKPDKLTEMEFYVVKRHPYYTYRILQGIDGFQTIAEWAAFHHETLDGKGYPFHIKGDALSLGSRIVAVADIFTALTEERTYHSDIMLSEVENIMYTMVQDNKIDGALVALMFSDKNALQEIAGQKIDK